MKFSKTIFIGKITISVTAEKIGYERAPKVFWYQNFKGRCLKQDRIQSKNIISNDRYNRCSFTYYNFICVTDHKTEYRDRMKS